MVVVVVVVAGSVVVVVDVDIDVAGVVDKVEVVIVETIDEGFKVVDI